MALFLSLLQPTKTKKAFQNNKERGLFHLIFSSKFFEACLKWTNDELAKKGESKVSKEKFMAYVGLEMAMSLVPLNNIFSNVDMPTIPPASICNTFGD